MDAIDWYKFDWLTFSVLILAMAITTVGLVTAIAILRTGSRQADILKNQVELERLKLAHYLYEKRYRAYDASSALLAGAISGDRSGPADDVAVRFMAALTEARFLYPHVVIDDMEEIWEKVQMHYAHGRRSISDYAEDTDMISIHAERAIEINTWLDQRLVSLHEVFPQLMLYKSDRNSEIRQT